MIFLRISNLYSGSWLSACYVLIAQDDSGQNHAAVIDPSAPASRICDFLKEHGASLDMIILTHGHFDHIMSLDELRDMTGAQAYIHREDAEMLDDSRKNAYSFFFPGVLRQRPAENLLSDGDVLKLGNEMLKVIHLPGHSKGSIALLGDGFLVTGDTLFDGGIGRSDLYGGNEMQLYESIGRLKMLDGNLRIYPGHGKDTALSKAFEELY